MTKVAGADDRSLIGKVLSRPDLFPEQFLSWLRKFISDNRTISVAGASSSTSTATVKKHLDVLWQAQRAPSLTGAGAAWIIPQKAGADINFTLTTIKLFFEVACVGTYTVSVEQSTDHGVTWVSLGTVTVTNAQLGSTTLVAKTSTSGNIVRVNWTALGSTGYLPTVQLEGDET